MFDGIEEVRDSKGKLIALRNPARVELTRRMALVEADRQRREGGFVPLPPAPPLLQSKSENGKPGTGS